MTASDPLARVRKVSGILQTVTFFAVAVLVVASAVMVTDPAFLVASAGFAAEAGPGRHVPGHPAGVMPGPEQRAGLAILLIVKLVAIVAVLLAVARLFGCFRRGQVFVPVTAAWVRRIGLRLLVFVVVMTASYTAAGLLMTWNLPEGERMLAVRIDGTAILLGLAGGLMIVIGWVMQIATAIADENAGFV